MSFFAYLANSFIMISPQYPFYSVSPNLPRFLFLSVSLSSLILFRLISVLYLMFSSPFRALYVFFFFRSFIFPSFRFSCFENLAHNFLYPFFNVCFVLCFTDILLLYTHNCAYIYWHTGISVNTQMLQTFLFHIRVCVSVSVFGCMCVYGCAGVVCMDACACVYMHVFAHVDCWVMCVWWSIWA